MKKNYFSCFFKYLLCSVCAGLFISAGIAAAQRQTAGRQSFGAWASFSAFSDTRPFDFSGGGASWSLYDYAGRLTAGVDVSLLPVHLTVPEVTAGEAVAVPEQNYDFQAIDILASGGYLFRVWAPRSRVVVLSAGGSLGVGVRYCREFGDVVKLYDNGKPLYYLKAGFLMTFLPEIQFEVFPFRNVSATLSFRPHVNFVCGLAGSSPWFRPVGQFGIKYYL